MSNINELLLMTGGDIAFTAARSIIHQPRIFEIAMIGERAFQIGSRFISVNKNILTQQDKVELGDIDNFDIFMSVMSNPEKNEYKTDSFLVLSLLFPNSIIQIEKEKILIRVENSENISSINRDNFKEFQSIISKIFCLGESKGQSGYDPADIYAKKIAEKIQKGKVKKAKEEKEKEENSSEINLFSRYISILSIGLQKSKNELSQYTVYQITDEFERYRRKISYDIYIDAKMAGASDLEEVKNWMEDIHS